MESTRDRMIATAANLFGRQGYHATGVQELLTAGQLPRGSFYFHFPGGKEQLACAALTQVGEQLRLVMEGVVAGRARVEEAVRAVVHFLAERLTASAFADGCPIAAVAGEMASTSEPIRGACSLVYADWTRVLAERLIAEGRTPERAEELATALLAMIEGALLLARTHRTVAPLQAISAVIPAVLS